MHPRAALLSHNALSLWPVVLPLPRPYRLLPFHTPPFPPPPPPPPTSWPHQSVPASNTSFRELLSDLTSLIERYPEPLIVHDDRGFGPTGVMLACLHGMASLEKKFSVDVLRIVASTSTTLCGGFFLPFPFLFVFSPTAPHIKYAS